MGYGMAEMKIELAWYNVEWDINKETEQEIEKAICKIMEKAVGSRNVNGVSVLSTRIV
jgi:hypothetical protein